MCQIKRERAGWDHIWELEMVYSKPVDFMEVTGGVVDQVSGQRFRITPATTYFRGGARGGDAVKIGFKASYSGSGRSSRPVLDTIIVNGAYHRCDAASQQPGTRPALRPAFKSTARPQWPNKVRVCTVAGSV